MNSRATLSKRMRSRTDVLAAAQGAYDYAAAAIDLSGCGYGAPHWEGPFVDTPCAYYFFLAGFVAQLPCTRILEIGSHYGGAIFSMARAVEHRGLSPSAEIVTVDCVDQNTNAFRDNRIVRRVLGDCFNPELARRVQASFTAPIDLMFIDAVHDLESTKRCIELYRPLVAPGLIVLDDIRLNASMKTLWSELSAVYGQNAIDITDVSRRGSTVGFGLLVCG